MPIDSEPKQNAILELYVEPLFVSDTELRLNLSDLVPNYTRLCCRNRLVYKGRS